MKDKPPKIGRAELEAAARIANSKSYSQRPVSKGRNAAFERMLELLHISAKHYELGDLADQRAAVSDSLVAVCDFLTERGVAPTALRPLMRPVDALADLLKNKPDELFSQRLRVGAPRTLDAHHRQSGKIAACANHWLEYHRDKTVPQKKQLPMAAIYLANRGFVGLTAAEITQARELVSGEARDHPAVKAAALVRQALDELSDKFGPHEALRLLLSQPNWRN